MHDTNMQEQADETVDTDYKPIYDQAVEDGAITGWGWMTHHTGGRWRRTLYHTAASMEGLPSGMETVGQMRDEKMGDSDGVSKACRSHQDYIWRSVAGSGRGVRGAGASGAGPASAAPLRRITTTPTTTATTTITTVMAMTVPTERSVVPAVSEQG